MRGQRLDPQQGTALIPLRGESPGADTQSPHTRAHTDPPRYTDMHIQGETRARTPRDIHTCSHTHRYTRTDRQGCTPGHDTQTQAPTHTDHLRAQRQTHTRAYTQEHASTLAQKHVPPYTTRKTRTLTEPSRAQTRTHPPTRTQTHEHSQEAAHVETHTRKCVYSQILRDTQKTHILLKSITKPQRADGIGGRNT